MMKKLLVLMLVLGLASLANATVVENLEWIDGNVTWTLDISNSLVYATTSSAGAYLLDFIQQTSGIGRLDPVAYALLELANGNSLRVGTYDAAGDAGQVWDPLPNPNDGIYWNVEAADADGGTLPNLAIGRLFEFDVTWDGNDEFEMKQYDGTGFQSRLAGVVPEPMTMLLLGLGGLFLRRRKA